MVISQSVLPGFSIHLLKTRCIC